MKAPSILLACHELPLAQSIEHLFRRVGLEVVIARGGVDCVAKLRARAPELVVLDPGLRWGGYDGVIAAMKDDPELSRIPVLLLASFTQAAIS